MAESDQEAADRREAETALTRARGHVAELRRLYERGAGFHEAHPYFEQLEADLNTARPQTAGAVRDWQGNELNADGTRRTVSDVPSTIEPGSMASQPYAAEEVGYQGAPADQPITERGEEIATVQQQRTEDGETAEQKAARMRAADGVDA